MSLTNFKHCFVTFSKIIATKQEKLLTLHKLPQNEDNKTYQNIINDLIINEEFETTEEIEETNRRIQSYQRQIKRNKDSMEQNKLEIAELRKAITDIESAIQKMKKKGVS